MDTHNESSCVFPQYASGLLSVVFPHGTSYEDAKELLEDLGLAVHEKRLMWEYSWTVSITVADEELDKWITHLQANSRIIDVQKIPLRYALET